MVAAVFEARMSREQAEQLAELMEEHRPTRPEGVITALLLVDGEDVRLVAVWRDRETLDAYLATGAVPRGTELMRKVGAEPTLRVVDVLDLG
jgi:quinol monooxygenase YgiN